MKTSLVDTDILSLLFRGHPHVVAQFEAYFKEHNIISFSVITDSTEKRPKTGFLRMNHSGNFGRTLEKPGFFRDTAMPIIS